MAAQNNTPTLGGPGPHWSTIGNAPDGPMAQPAVQPASGAVPPMDAYPGGVPDFRNPDQNPNPNYYDPNSEVEQYGYQTGIDGERNYDVNVGMTGGLMDTISAIESSPYANNGYGVAPGRAVNRRVNQNETSQYQLGQMLDENGALMQRVAARANAQGAGRGLMNSSITAGNAQGAMIDAAQPFALQDASWYGQTAADNMGATNRMAEANLNMRGRSMEAGAARDRQILQEQLSGYGDIRRAMIDIETREDTQAYGTGEREGAQAFTTGEREGAQAFTTGEREGAQDWQTGEGEAGRNWQTGERLGTQDHQAEQNQINRDWTSNENMLTNSLAWAQTKLDAATRLGITREQAFADMYSSIMNNNNPKFTAAQREQAVRNMNATLNAKYGETDPGPYESSYDPATGKYDESLRPPPVDPEEAAAAARATVVGGDKGRDQYFDPSNPWKSYPQAQVYGSKMGPTYGYVTAGLPAV
jgi:hypothetical protein